MKSEHKAYVLSQLDEAGITSAHLDGHVHDTASEIASGVNNEGLEAQVEYLLESGTWTPADIIFNAKKTKEENPDD